MNRIRCLTGQRGLSLVELMVVMGVVGILMTVGGISFYQTSSQNDVLNCAKRIVADVTSARRAAQGAAGRVVFLTSFPGPASAKADTGPLDLDGDGVDEFYISFEDNVSRTGQFVDAATTPLLVHGTPGDTLCAENVVFKQESTLRTGISSSSSTTSGGTTTTTFTNNVNGKLVFSGMGTLINFGAANQNLYLEKNGQVARIEFTGLTGVARIYVNRPAYEDCGGSDCAVGTNNWQPLHRSL